MAKTPSRTGNHLVPGRDYVDVAWLEMLRAYTVREKREYLNTFRLCGNASRAMIVALEVMLGDEEKVLLFPRSKLSVADHAKMEKLARSSTYGRNSSGGDDVA